MFKTSRSRSKIVFITRSYFNYHVVIFSHGHLSSNNIFLFTNKQHVLVNFSLLHLHVAEFVLGNDAAAAAQPRLPA